MDPLKIIKIGDLATMEIYNDMYPDQYLSTKITDFDEEENILAIALPVVNRQYLIARNKDKIKVSIKKDDGIYSFVTTVITRSAKPYAHIKLNMPKNLVREQRREFFRLPLNILVYYNILDDDERLKAVSLDISGGGIRMVTKKDLNMKDHLSITFELDNGDRFNDVEVKIKRKDNRSEDQFEYGLEFIDVNDEIRQRIISYLFMLQRNRGK